MITSRRVSAFHCISVPSLYRHDKPSFLSNSLSLLVLCIILYNILCTVVGDGWVADVGGGKGLTEDGTGEKNGWREKKVAVGWG